MRTFQRIQLKNGLRIVVVPQEHTTTATVMVLVEAGSKYETAKNNGISHFLEHMCFKGTETRSVFQITEELDALGAESNAFTSQEYTGYYAKSHHHNLEKLIDIVSDIYLGATLPQQEIEKEKGVILEEIHMYEDMPQRKVWDVWESLLYGDQPAGMTVLGPEENIKKFTRKDFLSYRKQHYVASATTIVVSGSFDAPSVMKKIKKVFKDIPTGKKSLKKKVRETQKNPQVRILHKSTDQAHMVVGVRSFPYHDTRNYALYVMATILGQGMSSRLFKIMRDERGMCYYVRAVPNAYTDVGYFAVHTGVSKSRMQEALEVILKEMQRLKHEEISEKELHKAKEFIIGIKALSLESSSDYAEWYGLQEVYHEALHDIDVFHKKIKSVTAQDIQKVAQTILVENQLNVAVVGPYTSDKQIMRLLKL